MSERDCAAGAEGMPGARLRVFAGTTEGRLLCEWLSGRGIGARAYAATEYGGELLGDLPGIEVRTGRLDERAMESELAGAGIVVDATHPFATLASENIRAASQAAGARYVRLARVDDSLPCDSCLADSPAPIDAASHGQSVSRAVSFAPADSLRAQASAAACPSSLGDVIVVGSIAQAASLLAHLPGRALLTTGSKELTPFSQVEGFSERFFVRVLPTVAAVGKCAEAGFSPSHVIGMQGPFSRELNAAMLRQVGASWLVTKDSGTVGGTGEKIAAARDVGAGCIVVARPIEAGDHLTLREVEALLAEIAR